MKIYSARQPRFDPESTISELSSQIKDNKAEIQKACEFLQSKLSKKFKDFNISVSWVTAIGGYKITIVDKLLRRTCILEPLNPQSQGSSNLSTNCIRSYGRFAENIPVSELDKYIKVFNGILKIQKACIQLIEDNNLPKYSAKQERDQLKNNESYKLLREYSRNPDIWIGDGNGHSYYRLCPYDIHKYQLVYIVQDRVHSLRIYRYNAKMWRELDDGDILTTSEIPFTEEQLRLLNEGKEF